MFASLVSSGFYQKVTVLVHVAMVTVIITMLSAFKFFFMKHGLICSRYSLLEGNRWGFACGAAAY